MQDLYINGRNMGTIAARRYVRVNIANQPYNNWYFAMNGGYEISVHGMQIKSFNQIVKDGKTAVEIITFNTEDNSK